MVFVLVFPLANAYAMVGPITIKLPAIFSTDAITSFASVGVKYPARNKTPERAEAILVQNSVVFHPGFGSTVNAGWVVTHEQLLTKVWGFEYRDEPHYVRLYINYLRKKIEKDPANPEYILTERGVGYRFIDYRRK